MNWDKIENNAWDYYDACKWVIGGMFGVITFPIVIVISWIRRKLK